MKCSSCGSENGEMKSGISKKNGKPWTGWRCSDCDNMTFISDQQPKTFNQSPKPAPQEPKKFEADIRKIRADVMGCAVGIVKSRIESGEKVEQPAKSTIHIFRLLLQEVLEPFSSEVKGADSQQ